MRYLLFVWLGCIIGFSQSCQSQTPQQSFISDSLRKHYQEKFIRYLQKDISVTNHITIADTGIALYASLADKQKNNIEYAWNWTQISQLEGLLKSHPARLWARFSSKKSLLEIADSVINKKIIAEQKKTNLPLSGYKIALDPGHVAGSLQEAKMEGKYVEMTLIDGTKIHFFESELAWYTARILQTKLEKLGAEVLLTRDQYNHTAFNIPFRTWYHQFIYKQKKQGKFVQDKFTVFFKEFKKPDFEERVRKINKFGPDLTLILHYNVDATNTNWSKPVKTNNSMAFVGGAFMKNELKKKEGRFHLLRLLISDDWDNSVEFSRNILQGLQNQLSIHPVPRKNKQFFLEKNCLPTQVQGVYARNLTLARKVYGTICYAEPLYQDNERECRLLNRRNLSWEGKNIPARLEEVAEGYLQGIVLYCKQNK